MAVREMNELIEGEWNYLEGNAYHEAGHAIVGWALDLRVCEITIRDDRPGEHAKMAGAERLRLIDLVAIKNAGRQAEEGFGHLLPSWASARDREDTLNLLADNEIRETPEIEKWIDDGRARARKILREHEREVHALAARLMECRHMTGDEFERFMKTAKG
jgi:ATP-dependent Zn protease